MDDPVLGTVRWAALFALLVVAAYTDLVHKKVYNWTTFPGVILGLGLAWAADRLDPAGGQLVSSLAGLGIAFGVFFVAYIAGGISAGDVKLMAAIGALLGLPLIVDAMFWGILAGAIIALGRLSLEGRLLAGIRSSVTCWFSLRGGAKEPRQAEVGRITIPYGLALAIGTLWAVALHQGQVLA